MFVGETFAILTSQKILLWSIQENRSSQKSFEKNALNMF